MSRREFKIRTTTKCYGHGDYSLGYVADPKEFDAYTKAHLITKDESYDVVEIKDGERIFNREEVSRILDDAPFELSLVEQHQILDALFAEQKELG